MSFLARFRALTKILAVVMLLALLAVGITWLGVSAMSSLNDGAANMCSAAKRALVATRAAQAVLVLNRSEFAVALDPSDQNRTEMKKAIEAQLKNFQERIEDTGKTRDDANRLRYGSDQFYIRAPEEMYRLFPNQEEAVKRSQEIADSDRGAVERAMESLPKPFTVSPETASVMAVNTYPLGLDIAQLQRVADAMHQFIGAPRFSIQSMLTDSG